MPTRVHLQAMNKRLLSIITSASLIASTLAMGAGAAPSAIATGDSAFEYIPESVFEEAVDVSDNENAVAGPMAVEYVDSAEELNTYFGTPEISADAHLLSELIGEGTKESPYLISSADDLFLMASDINSGATANSHYKLTCDIDLGGAEWTPAGYYDKSKEDPYSTAFCGVFDGNGHTVSNFVITKADTSYIGFFGLVYGGSIKNFNIDGMTINLSSTNNERFYTGSLVARFVVSTENTTAAIENCNVTGSSITVSTLGTIYAGGIAGSVYAANKNDVCINVYFTNAECDIRIKSSATSKLGGAFHLAIAGGLVGYLGSETNSSVNVLKCSAVGNVSADTLPTSNASPIAGGLFGDIHIYDNSLGGVGTITSCYSAGTVVTKSQKAYLAGGFTGQIYANKTTYIKDCYSSSDVSGECTRKELYPLEDSSAGGFVGVIGYPGYSSYFEKQIVNCYASGDAIDLTHTESSSPSSSYVGHFTGWSTAAMFKNCYKLESQTLIGSDIFADDLTLLSEERAKIYEYYTGFDFTNTWTIDPSAEYPYPTLQDKTGYATFYVGDVFFETGLFGANGKLKAPSETPTKESTIDKTYTFLYWSLTEDGSAFDFANTVLTDNIALYAVFTESARKYKVNFVVDGNAYVPEQTLVYGSDIKSPAGTPEKADTEQYYYEFLHWSVIAGGEAYDFTSATVSGDVTFHAVFKEIDKSAWTGSIAESFSSGFGTQELPYVISTSDEFALFAKVINEAKEGYTDAYYVLGNNINLGDNYWVAIGTSSAPYSANFDGKGYSIGNFKVSPSQYAGVFGYVFNGTIKNVHITSFEVDLSVVATLEKNYIHVGGLAGYVDSKSGTSEISGVRVDALDFNISATTTIPTSNTDKTSRIYAGGIAGFITARTGGYSVVTDSFATSDIVVKNPGGYAYAGGIAGRSNINSGGLSQIIRCYNTGSVSASSLNSSFVGGLVGYIWSEGSDFVGPSADDTANLTGDDEDTMIEDCFSVTNVSANSSAYYSNAGRLVGSANTFAGIVDSYYPRGSVISITPNEETIRGYSVELAMLKDKTWLSNNRGFDFENTWTFSADSMYPVLKSMVSDKPALKIADASLSEGTLSANIRILSKEECYTLVIGVYNARNQLIKFERINFEKSDVLNEVAVTYEGMKGAKFISVTAVETTSLKPLFSEVRKSL